MRNPRKSTRNEYLRKKNRSLNDEEKREIKDRIEKGDADVYLLAAEFGCVPTQIAGIKARRRF